MTRVWEWNRPVTVREVLEDLQKERSIAYTTVMTVLDNLHQKGWVRREAEGRAYRYEAVSTRAAYSAALMNEAWSTSDNPAAALVAFFGMMSPEQRNALRDAVRMVQVDEPAPPTELTDATEAPATPERSSGGGPAGEAEGAPREEGRRNTAQAPDAAPEEVTEEPRRTAPAEGEEPGADASAAER
ncbi:BlaI/MecI/CopY family transcriptional regulator [Streptomyces sp. NPDC059080]|uniref:BlaI/MecI/CopY family transcriptional regulator n=1 Tax=Streptomyces sp. NPDC059080 TaxID=3346718 RepID=UPI0036A935CD